MTIHLPSLFTIMGWVCQGVFTAGILSIFARLKFFPYVIFFHGKPPSDNTPKAA